MAQIVLLPQIGVSEESAVVASFNVKPGDAVTIGTPLFSLETGKSVFEVASEYEGTVLALMCGEGDELPIKAPVMAIGQPGEKYEAAPPPAGGAPSRKGAGELDGSAIDGTGQASALNSETSTYTLATEPIPKPTFIKGLSPQRVGLSPRARALADKAGVDAFLATPTGPEGLIIERDVRKMLDEGIPADAPKVGQAAAALLTAASIMPAVPVVQSAPDYTDTPLTQMRKTIAKNMLASLTSAAQLTHSSSFDAAEVLAYRAKCKNDSAMKDVTLGDMVLFAVSRTLPDFPDMNAHFLGDATRRFKGVHLAVAVDVPGGLVVPVIRDAHKMSLIEISREVKALAKAGRDGSIAPSELTGGTFTVSNLGSLGVEHFTPIINPPQVGILGVNNSTLRPRRKPDGTVEFYDAIGLSLTYDHRAVDGAPASRFLKALCDNLAAFTLLLGR